jgi:hypothetical protein
LPSTSTVLSAKVHARGLPFGPRKRRQLWAASSATAAGAPARRRYAGDATVDPAGAAQQAGDVAGRRELADADRDVVAFLGEARDPVGEVQPEREARVARRQPDQIGGHERREDERQRDRDLALGLATDLLHRLAGAEDALDRAAAAVEEHHALAGQRDRARAAVEQLDAEVVLQPLDRLAHRGGRDAEAGGGAAEAALLGDPHERQHSREQIRANRHR